MRGLGERENEKGNLFRVAKQMVNRNGDIVGANCVKNSDWKIVVEEDRLMEVWRAHYDVLSNKEFSWDREGLTDVSPVCGPCERISVFWRWMQLLVRGSKASQVVQQGLCRRCSRLR